VEEGDVKSQTKIGRIEVKSGQAKDNTWKHRGLNLSLLVAIGTVELTVGALARANPQATNSLDTTVQLSVKTPAQDWPPQIIVRVHNYSQIDAHVLLESEQVASNILGKAGVDSVWLTCSSGEGSHSDSDCAKPSSASDLNLNLPKPDGARLYQRADSVYGFTLGKNVWVFFDRVKTSASEHQLNTAHIMGNVIAHEFGHLLLGDNAHSSWGLMRARWSPEQLRAADRGELSFSNVERVKILHFVIAGHQAQGLVQLQTPTNY
jgi:hypothetical protein